MRYHDNAAYISNFLPRCVFLGEIRTKGKSAINGVRNKPGALFRDTFHLIIEPPVSHLRDRSLSTGGGGGGYKGGGGEWGGGGSQALRP